MNNYYIFAFFITASIYGTCLCSIKSDAMVACIKEYPTEQNVLEFALNGELRDETDRNAKCLFHCVAQRMGYTESNTPDQIKAQFLDKHPDYANNGELDNTIKECISTASGITDNCEATYRVTKCLMKAYLSFLRKS